MFQDERYVGNPDHLPVIIDQIELFKLFNGPYAILDKIIGIKTKTGIPLPDR